MKKLCTRYSNYSKPKNTILKQLLTTSLYSSLCIMAANILNVDNANATIEIVFDSNYSNPSDIISNNNITPPDGIVLFQSTAIFGGEITTNNNNNYGIYAELSNVTFNNTVTANENFKNGLSSRNSVIAFDKKAIFNKNLEHGIDISSTMITFNNIVELNENKGQGISAFQLTANFKDTLTANENLINGINAFSSTFTFDEAVTTINNIGNGIVLSGSNVTFNGDVTTDSLIMSGNNQIEFGKGVAISAPVINFNLSNDSSAKFIGSLVPIDKTGVITINTTHDGTNAGHLEMTEIGDLIDFTNSKELIINITDASMTQLPAEGVTRTFDLFVENGGTLSLNGNFTVNYDNEFVNWTFDNKTGILSQKLAGNAEEVLGEAVGNDNLQNLTPETKTELLNIASNQGAAAASEAIERLTNSDAVALAI